MKLKLFYKTECPYSKKVYSFVEKNKLENEVDLHAVDSVPALKEFSEISGKTQVPCLIIGARPLFESDAIIDWLKKNFSKAA